MRVGVTGATGLIGRAFSAQTSHEVVRLRRDGDLADIDALDAVVHLGGEPIDQGRLDDAHKRRVKESRVDGTARLVASLARLRAAPRVFVCASGVGYYGDRGDAILDESSTNGDTFLANVCREWEAAAQTAQDHGMRVVCLRTGVVLTSEGGALKRMLPPFLVGVGGTLGDGKQWMSCISLDDQVAVIERTLADERLNGPINSVCPAPITNDELTRVLARLLHRPAFFRVPRFALRAMFGAVADEMLLPSTRAVPAKLSALGHQFRHATVEEALKRALDSRP